MGHTRDRRVREEERQQARMAQERAHQQEILAIRNGEYLESEVNEYLVIIEGYSTINSEVRVAQRRADESERRLKELQARVAKAEAREKAIEEAEAGRIETEERIRELEALRKEQEETEIR